MDGRVHFYRKTGTWASGTTYADGDRVVYVTTDVHEVYESVQNANTGHDPTTSPTWWVLVSATNRWKMFDESMSTQTAGDSSISVTVLPRQRIDSICLFNVSASELRIVIDDPVDGVVYDQTTSVVDASGVADWWAYFFEPVVREKDIVVLNLPIYSNADITVTLTDATTVLCGALVFGLAKDTGYTQYGAGVGIQDFSIKEADQWGNYYITERAYSKRVDLTVWVESFNVDALQKLLASYRATPVVYVGSGDYASSAVYGFFKDFSIDITYPSVSICTVSIEGLASRPSPTFLLPRRAATCLTCLSPRRTPSLQICLFVNFYMQCCQAVFLHFQFSAFYF